MTMSSNEKEMHDTLNAYVQKGDPNNEIASSLKWTRYPLYYNLRSHFQDQSSHISDVEAEYYDGAVHYETLRNNTVGWIATAWFKCRDVRTQDLSRSTETFLKIVEYVLGGISPRFNLAQFKILFRQICETDPSRRTIPQLIGKMLKTEIKDIESTGHPGDPRRDLKSMVEEYNNRNGRATASAAFTRGGGRGAGRQWDANTGANGRGRGLYRGGAQPRGGSQQGGRGGSAQNRVERASDGGQITCWRCGWLGH
jgi:hypothetical protein